MKVKSYRAEAGVSVEIKGNWYKFYNAIEVELDELDNVQEAKEKAWNTVHLELEKQVEETIKAHQ